MRSKVTGEPISSSISRTSLTAKVELAKEVNAPVQKGQELGLLTVYSGEKMLIQLPLVAGETVERLSFWDVMKQFMKKIVGKD